MQNVFNFMPLIVSTPKTYKITKILSKHLNITKIFVTFKIP